MKIEKVDFTETPDQLVAESYDCLWVRLAPRDKPAPLASAALQWLDWQLQGKLSEMVASGEKRKETTFFATMRKLPVPFVAVDGGGAADWERFLHNCRGMKLKRVLYFCEDAERAADYEKQLREFRAEDFPEIVAFGAERAVKSGK
jgi:hypothetical protein